MFTLLLLLLAAKPELIQGTAGSKSDDLSIQAGGVVLREGEPGAAFATVRAGKAKRRLAFFVVLKHRYPGEGRSASDEDVTVEGTKGTARHNLTVDGKTLALTYAVTLDAAKKPKGETLTVAGKVADLAKGNVFLVDMTADPPRWEQRKLELPAEVGDLSTKAAAAALAKQAIAGLIKQDRKVKAFVDGEKR
jgi:hypothetical protein